MTHLSLFTGIGDIDIAAEWAGFDTVGQCEWADYPTKVLEKHWPDVPRWRDIKDLTIDSYANQWYNNLDDKSKEVINVASKSEKYSGAKQMYYAGLSIQECAEIYDISRQAMWKILQRRGVEFRPQQRAGKENHFYRGTSANDFAQNVLEYAIRKNIIERKNVCELCENTMTYKDGRTGIHAHHSDYNKPLEVMWLCKPCHHEWHKNNKAKEVMQNENNQDNATVDVLRDGITVITGGFP